MVVVNPAMMAPFVPPLGRVASNENAETAATSVRKMISFSLLIRFSRGS
jgi:hypothetical protein